MPPCVCQVLLKRPYRRKFTIALRVGTCSRGDNLTSLLTGVGSLHEATGPNQAPRPELDQHQLHASALALEYQ